MNMELTLGILPNISEQLTMQGLKFQQSTIDIFELQKAAICRIKMGGLIPENVGK